jgi:hypothetical protein
VSDSLPARREGQALAQISLVDLLDRLLGAGVVVAGDVVISLSGVDLVQIRLNAVITTVREDMPAPLPAGRGDRRG